MTSNYSYGKYFTAKSAISKDLVLSNLGAKEGDLYEALSLFITSINKIK